MHQALREAGNICKTLLRNGYNAHVINPNLQERLLNVRRSDNALPAVDIACEPDLETLARLFPKTAPEPENQAMAILEENGVIIRFYPIATADTSHPEASILRLTPTMLQRVPAENRPQMHLTGYGSSQLLSDAWQGFADIKEGSIRLLGLPDETLRHNYLLAIRALRYAANYDLPVEPNTWMAIVRSATRVLDYVPASDIMGEWRKVAAESMHRFVRLLYDAHILQGLIPEVAALACVIQQNDSGVISGNVFEHTLKAMELYPQYGLQNDGKATESAQSGNPAYVKGGLHHDWLGTMAMLFHDVGKLYTAEFFDGRWTYYQHHQVGARVTRKILRRLHFDQVDTDLICHLVNNHMRFHFMMTDRGIRRFRALGETQRFIALAKADLLAREDSFTSFNHNIKYLDRAELPEQMLEPLLNGNEIMEETQLAPGKLVGVIRDALLAAQKSGEVADRDEALVFVREYAGRMQTQ